MSPSILLEIQTAGTETLLNHKIPTKIENLSVPTSSMLARKRAALMHRSFNDHPQVAVQTSGSNIELERKETVIDGCGGAVVQSIGSGNEEVIEAVLQQLMYVGYIHTGAYTTLVAEELADVILAVGPEGFQHGLVCAYLCGSGSEANEAAMKLAKQYHYERHDHERVHFVSRLQSYHGSSVGAMSISSNLARKVPYNSIMLPNVSFVSPAFAYHYQRHDESEEQYSDRLVAELDEHFQFIGTHKIISFIAEPVVGATSGCVSAPTGYFQAVRRLCDKYGILLHLDEVMCGMGRTGTVFAFEHDDVQPDIVTVGKGLGAGYAPIAGVLMNQRVADSIKNGSGVFNHGHTYQNHAAGCAAALAVQKIIKRDELVQRVAKLGIWLHQLLADTFEDSQYVGDIRGRGFMQALEFVADKETKKSFPADMRFGYRVQKRAHELGLDVYPGTGTVDGVRGDHVIVAPAFNMSEIDMKRIVVILKAAYDVEVSLL